MQRHLYSACNKRVTACNLDATELDALKANWNKLAMRHFMVSTKARIDPIGIQCIRCDVENGLAELRRDYGTACVLEIR